MDARTQFKEYEDKFGLIGTAEKESSGNGLLYTSEMLINLHRLGFLEDADQEYYVKKLISCQKERGLYGRSPENKDQEGIDDYVGLMAAFHILNRLDLAEEILNYGKRHYFVYNNSEIPNRSSWFLRFPHVVCHFYWAAGKKAPAIFAIYWFLERMIATITLKKQNQDGILLGYLLGIVARGKNKLIDWVLNKFEDKVFSLYSGGYSEVAAIYFNNKEHPLSKYWPYSIFEHAVIHDK